MLVVSGNLNTFWRIWLAGKHCNKKTIHTVPGSICTQQVVGCTDIFQHEVLFWVHKSDQSRSSVLNGLRISKMYIRNCREVKNVSRSANQQKLFLQLEEYNCIATLWTLTIIEKHHDMCSYSRFKRSECLYIMQYQDEIKWHISAIKMQSENGKEVHWHFSLALKIRVPNETKYDLGETESGKNSRTTALQQPIKRGAWVQFTSFKNRESSMWPTWKWSDELKTMQLCSR